MPMDRKKAIDSSKKAVSVFFKIRRGFKIYIAFITGILTAVTLYRELFKLSENRPYSIALALLGGAFITVMMLLIMEIIRLIIGRLKKAGLLLWEKSKGRKGANEADKKEDQAEHSQPQDKSGS